MSQSVVWYHRLTTRVLFFLTLAMVPIGVIGVMQNQRLSTEIEKRSELSLMALTERAASGESQLIQRAFGAAEALGGISSAVLNEPDVCRAVMQRFLKANDVFAFAGFVRPDGKVTCSSIETVLDYSQHPRLPDLMANPRPDVQVNLSAEGSGKSVMVISHPYYEDDTFKGYFSVSLQLRDVGETEDFMGDANPITLVTFNAQGQLLSSEEGRARAETYLPRDIALANLAVGNARTLVAESVSGQRLVYSIVPIVPDVIYALGSWKLDRLENTGAFSGINDAILPFLMWLASLLVVWFVMDRLVIDRVKKLNTAMTNFAQSRKLPEEGAIMDTSSELGALELSLIGMAQDIMHDEAEQENRLREKSVLLKEVHHRVKNNLQIISSIMNMQIRKAKADETKRALGQVQDRIMGLSGVHRTLYDSENLTQVDAAALIEKIVEQSRAIGTTKGVDVDIALKLETVTIFPDQAVPLSMLVSEALTNAMKYIGGEKPQLKVSLMSEDEKHARLVIENSCTRTKTQSEDWDVMSTGLGQQLIRAFTSQLSGRYEVEETDDIYRLIVVFDVEPFKDEPLDY